MKVLYTFIIRKYVFLCKTLRFLQYCVQHKRCHIVITVAQTMLD